ncbi:NmrA family NAD(P)-binding protein [Catellatospora coxensis]
MSEATIAVTGATGRLGARVAHRLAEAGLPQRLVVRDPSRAPNCPARRYAARRTATARPPSTR